MLKGLVKIFLVLILIITLRPGNTRRWVIPVRFHIIWYDLRFLVRCITLTRNCPGRYLWDGTCEHKDQGPYAYRFQQLRSRLYLFVNSIRQNHWFFPRNCNFLSELWRVILLKDTINRLKCASGLKLEYLVASFWALFPLTKE